MGHSVGISDSYYRPTEHSLREDYLKPVDKLTVTNSQAMIKKFSESQQALPSQMAHGHSMNRTLCHHMFDKRLNWQVMISIYFLLVYTCYHERQMQREWPSLSMDSGTR
jgi:hypothetical protein